MKKVIRVLIYEGEDDWVDFTLSHGLPRSGTVSVGRGSIGSLVFDDTLCVGQQLFEELLTTQPRFVIGDHRHQNHEVQTSCCTSVQFKEAQVGQESRQRADRQD